MRGLIRVQESGVSFCLPPSQDKPPLQGRNRVWGFRALGVGYGGVLGVYEFRAGACLCRPRL